MYLARREFGKALRVYPLKTIETPSAWPFFCDHTDELGFKVHTAAAARTGASSGMAATGYTRVDALANLNAAEADNLDERIEFPEQEAARA